MTRSKIRGRIPSLEEYVSDVLYRPYDDKLSVTVREDESVIIEGGSWKVILDHSRGDMYFCGECLRYYDIDTIKDIFDSYGDIYTIINRDKTPRTVYAKTKEEKETEEIRRKIEELKERQKEWYDKRRKEMTDEDKARVKEKQRLYYLEHRDEYLRRSREQHRRKKEKDINK